MLVVKIGGSLYNTPELKKWLHCLKNYSQQQSILIVPGGGPFADQVRTAQNLHHFDDKQAHHMAILAMAQFALLIKGIEPQCQLFHYPNNKMPSSALSVWLPDERLLAINELAQNWSVTSDSLALWLAQQLQADELIMIKRAQNMSNSIADLVNKHVLDSSFEARYRSAPLKTRLVHFQDHVNFKPHLNSGLVIS
jgi:5-(aminomethyl)-3-furanmethanol phosphate kinase